MNNRLLKFASIGKKVTMGLAGLFLILFLLVHLGINLTLIRNDEGEWFRAASGFMGSNYLVKVFEIVLGAALLLHMILGVILWFENRMSRPVRYFRTNRSDTSFLSKYMFHTGVVIAVFLVIHFINFYFVKLGIVDPPPGVDTHDFYTMARLLFTNPVYSAIYIVALILMGFHLNHSFQSAFQTLGLNHNRYYTLIKRMALVYAVVVAAGFILIPVFYLIKY
ncbi:MAG TPA: succinate dehydrogenase cytochrome b subunit [Bacteroidales bacterium]|nr:succinate dehydrogenase cytochrome b subunit [Bacteroidales bacterium]HRZ48522.1 succinate dehydrogenase cytochrome b subunit [Bacteroidales bacterium]